MRSTVVVGVVVYRLASVQPALAQRFPFERTFDATGASTLDVSTLRGKIDVTAGDPGRIVVAGTVTVRVDWNVPANAEDLAKQVAANPPIQQDAQRITLRPPSDPAAQRAVTVSYQVRVPPNTRVTTTSDSGATTVREVSGTVSVRTQSGAIELGKLGAGAEVTTGSGAVTIDGVARWAHREDDEQHDFGTVAWRKRSRAYAERIGGRATVGSRGRRHRNRLERHSRVRRKGRRDRIEPQRSHHDHRRARTGRGRADSGSGALDIGIESRAAFTVDATTGSGSVNVEGAQIQGSVTKRKVTGTVGAGGPLVRANSRSGSIHLKVGS